MQKFKALRAAWFMVVDGQITASGKTLSDYPTPEQLLEVCHRTGKFPFLFINDELMAIEESGSVWHPTIEPEDFYPIVCEKKLALLNFITTRAYERCTASAKWQVKSDGNFHGRAR